MARKPATAKKPARNKATASKSKAKSKYKLILTARRKGALEITFNRPEKLNAMNEDMAGEIIDAMAEVELDRKILADLAVRDEEAFKKLIGIAAEHTEA